MWGAPANSTRRGAAGGQLIPAGHRLNPQSSRVTVSASWIRQFGDLAMTGVVCTTRNREVVADSTPNDGEAPVIVGMADAAMHMYTAAIDTLPDSGDPPFPHHAGIILAGLRKLQGSLSEAAGRSRVTPSVIVALSGVRHRYDELMETAANGPGATLGQRLYIARGRAQLATKEAANGVGLRKDLIQAVEAEEAATEDETSRIKDLIAALGG